MLQIVYVLLCFYGLAKLLAFLRKNSVVQSEVTPTSRTGDYVNKLVLACILVPTGFWAVEKVQPYVHPLKVLTQLHRCWTWATMALREHLHAGVHAELQEEVTRVQNEIGEIEQMISETEAFDPQLAVQTRKSLEPLKNDLERLLALKGEEVQELAKQVIADLDRQLVAVKETARKEELGYTLRKSRIQFSTALAAARKATNPAATQLLNQWLDAIEQHDLPRARDLMTNEAGAHLTPRKAGELRDRLGKVESMQVTRRGGRLGFTIGEGTGHVVFVGIHTDGDGDRVAIDAVEF